MFTYMKKRMVISHSLIPKTKTYRRKDLSKLCNEGERPPVT